MTKIKFDDIEQWEYNWIGSKAKINKARILKRGDGLQQRYLDFIEENKNKEFTLKLWEHKNLEFDKSLSAGSYQFKEIEDMVWTFHISDLTIVEDNRRIHKE